MPAMINRLRCLLCCLLAGWAGTMGGAADSLPAAADRALLAALRAGGQVLYLRHFETNPDQADTDPLNLDNIAAQRQLTDAGRQHAVALGQALHELRVPVGAILCSRFYRAQESAALLGYGAAQPTADVSEGGQVVTPRENQRRAQALRQLLSTPPPAGQNILIVSHRPNLHDAAGKEFGDLAEGEIAVFAPLGEGRFRLVARIAPSSRWTAWAIAEANGGPGT